MTINAAAIRNTMDTFHFVPGFSALLPAMEKNNNASIIRSVAIVMLRPLPLSRYMTYKPITLTTAPSTVKAIPVRNEPFGPAGVLTTKPIRKKPIQNKKADILGEYLAVKEGRLYFPDVVDKYKFDYILTEEGELTDTYMRDVKGYKKIYDNNGMKLYAKIK